MALSPITITFELSPAEAALAGCDRAGEFTVPVYPSELSAPARALLAEIIGHKRRSSDGDTERVPVPTEGTIQAAHAWLEAVVAAIETRKRQAKEQYEARIQAALSRPDTDWIAGRGDRVYCLNHDNDGYSDSFGGRPQYEPALIKNGPSGSYFGRDELADPRIIERIKCIESGALAQARAEWEVKFREWQAVVREREARDLAVAQQKEAALKRRAAQLETWLAEHGTPAQRKRRERGLLPDAEIIDGIREQAFAPLDDFARFERITDADVLALAEEGYYEADYTTRKPESCTDEQIERVAEIERLMPGATVELVEHVGFIAGRTEADDPEIVRLSIKVTVRVGELTRSREYAA